MSRLGVGPSLTFCKTLREVFESTIYNSVILIDIDAMAELGDLFGGSTTTAGQKIEVEMLDYDYVRDCKDWNQLSAIVDVLKSGKEGHYPDVSILI